MALTPSSSFRAQPYRLTGISTLNADHIEQIDKMFETLFTDNAVASQSKFILQSADPSLPNAQSLALLSTGYLKVTTGTGVLSSQVVPIPATDGGTGQTSYTIGDLLYASTSTVLSKLAAAAAGKVLRAAGAGVAPAYSTFTIPDTFAQGDLIYASASNVLTALVKDTSATRYLSNTGASNAPAWAQITLTNGVTGTLPVTNGGTGLATATQGDLLYGSAANTYAALAKNTSATRYLSNTGASNNPAWAQIDLSNGVTGDLPFANLTQGSALSVLGVTGNGVADNASIAAGTDANILRRAGTAVAFGSIDLAAAGAVGTSILAVPNGGTGLATLTANQIPYGNGTGAFQSAAGFTFDGTTLTIPGQIAFPATQAASAGANTLDDYEEGSWTPVIGGSGGTSGQTYAVQVGRYVKIGKLVACECYVQLSVEGTITSNVQLQGLPFTSDSTSNLYSSGAVQWANLSTNWVDVVAQLNPNATTCTMVGATAAAASNNTALTSADTGASTAFILFVVYRTDV